MKITPHKDPVTRNSETAAPRSPESIHHYLAQLSELLYLLNEEGELDDNARIAIETTLFEMTSYVPRTSFDFATNPDQTDPQAPRNPQTPPLYYPNEHLSLILIDNYAQLHKFATSYFNLTLAGHVTKYMVDLVYKLQFWELYHLLQLVPELEYFLKLVDIDVTTTPFGHIIRPPDNYFEFSMRQGFQYPFPYPFYNYSYHTMDASAIDRKYKKMAIKPYIDITLKNTKPPRKKRRLEPRKSKIDTDSAVFKHLVEHEKQKIVQAYEERERLEKFQKLHEKDQSIKEPTDAEMESPVPPPRRKSLQPLQRLGRPPGQPFELGQPQQQPNPEMYHQQEMQPHMQQYMQHPMPHQQSPVYLDPQNMPPILPQIVQQPMNEQQAAMWRGQPMLNLPPQEGPQMRPIPGEGLGIAVHGHVKQEYADEDKVGADDDDDDDEDEDEDEEQPRLDSDGLTIIPSEHQKSLTEDELAKKQGKMGVIHQCHLADPQTHKPCLKIFYGKNELLRHKEFVHATKKRIYKCIYCARSGSKVQSYPRHDLLARHIRRKHGVTGKENKLAVHYAKENVEVIDDLSELAGTHDQAGNPLPHPRFLNSDYTIKSSYAGFLLFSSQDGRPAGTKRGKNVEYRSGKGEIIYLPEDAPTDMTPEQLEQYIVRQQTEKDDELLEDEVPNTLVAGSASAALAPTQNVPLQAQVQAAQQAAHVPSAPLQNTPQLLRMHQQPHMMQQIHMHRPHMSGQMLLQAPLPGLMQKRLPHLPPVLMQPQFQFGLQAGYLQYPVLPPLEVEHKAPPYTVETINFNKPEGSLVRENFQKFRLPGPSGLMAASPPSGAANVPSVSPVAAPSTNPPQGTRKTMDLAYLNLPDPNT